MALILADSGAVDILTVYLANRYMKLKLFTSDSTPTDDDSLASYIIAAGGGYADITLDVTSWVVSTTNDPRDAAYPEQTFTFTTLLTSSAIIYGYLCCDTASTNLFWGERFSTSFKPQNNGDIVKVTPKLQLSFGTPTS